MVKFATANILLISWCILHTASGARFRTRRLYPNIEADQEPKPDINEPIHPNRWYRNIEADRWYPNIEADQEPKPDINEPNNIEAERWYPNIEADQEPKPDINEPNNIEADRWYHNIEADPEPKPDINEPMTTINYPMPTIAVTMPIIDAPMPRNNEAMPTNNYPMPTVDVQMTTINYPMPTIAVPMLEDEVDVSEEGDDTDQDFVAPAERSLSIDQQPEQPEQPGQTEQPEQTKQPEQPGETEEPEQKECEDVTFVDCLAVVSYCPTKCKKMIKDRLMKDIKEEQVVEDDEDENGLPKPRSAPKPGSMPKGKFVDLESDLKQIDWKEVGAAIANITNESDSDLHKDLEETGKEVDIDIRLY